MSSLASLSRRNLAVAAALLAVLPGVVFAAEGGLDKFTLTRAIPADAFLAVHTRGHPGQEFLNQQYERVWEAIESARLDRVVKTLLKDLQKQAGGEGPALDEQWQQIVDLCSTVEWSKLAEREYAMGMRLGFPTPEFVCLMMPPTDKVGTYFDGLSGTVRKLVEMTGMLEIQTDDRGETVVHKINLPVPPPLPGLAFTLARHKDVIVVGFGSTMPEQALALLGGGQGQTLASTPRFRDAFKKLPPPTDGAIFADLAKLISQLRECVKSGIDMGAQSAGQDPEALAEIERGRKISSAAIDLVDLWDYCATVATTEGMKTTADSVTVLRSDAQSKPLYGAIYGNGPLRDPLKYVPKAAADFSVNSGVDFLAMYKAIKAFVRENIPEFEAQVAQLETTLKEQAQLDIEQDVLGWIKGGLITFSVPGATAYAPSEWTVMVGVRDAAKANEMLTRLLEAVTPMLQQQGAVADAEIEGAEGFRSLSLPQLMMFGVGKPTVGVKDDWLFLASSPEIVRTVLDVAAGKADNITKNERFVNEGIPATGNVVEASFRDLTNLGEQLAQLLSLTGFIQMMAPPQVMQNPVAKAVLTTMPKLARVARALNFFQSSATRTTQDGNVLTQRAIVTYREPPAVEKPTAPTPEQ